MEFFRRPSTYGRPLSFQSILINIFLINALITISQCNGFDKIENEENNKITNHTVLLTLPPVPTTTPTIPLVKNVSSLTTEKLTILPIPTTAVNGNNYEAKLNELPTRDEKENTFVIGHETNNTTTKLLSSPQKQVEPNNTNNDVIHNKGVTNGYNEIGMLNDSLKLHENVGGDNTPDDVITLTNNRTVEEVHAATITTTTTTTEDPMDFHFDLNRYTSTYNDHDEQPFHNFSHTQNHSQINAIDGDKVVNTSTEDFKENFHQLVLTTPKINFFDDKHREYETDPMFNHLGDGETDHFNHTYEHDRDDTVAEQTIVAATATPEILLDTIKNNSTDTLHTTVFYNNSEITNTRYDVETNEIRNVTHPHYDGDDGNNVTHALATTTEKRGKYLQVIGNEGEVNLTIPNTAEVWALASMKNVGHDKFKTGQYYNVTTKVEKSPESDGKRNNGTMATKQLADWVEVMKNDVFSNVTYGNTNETAHLKEPELIIPLPQDNASQENHIVAITENVAPPLPPPINPLPKKPENFTAEIVVSENKIDDIPSHQTKVDDVNGEFEVDDLAKSKVNPLARNDTIGEESHLARTATLADIVKNGLPHEDDMNVIRKIVYASNEKKNKTTETVTSPGTIQKTTTYLPLVHMTTKEAITTTDEPITTTDHQHFDEETTQPDANTEPTTILAHHITTAFDDDLHLHGPSDMSNVLTTTILATTDYNEHHPTTEYVTTDDNVDETTTHKNGDVHLVTEPNFIETSPNPTTINQQRPVETTTTKLATTATATTNANNDNHQAKVDIATTVINLNHDEYKYSTVVDVTTDGNVDATTTTLHSITGLKRKNSEKPLIAGIAMGGNVGHNTGNGPAIDEVPTEVTTDPMLPIDLGEIGGIQSEDTDTDVNAIIATTVSIVGVICLVLLVGFLIVMRKRQKQMTYGQRCRPVGLDAYSLDNVSVYNSVRRKGILRASKRSFGNAAFDDPSLKNNLLTMSALATYVQNKNTIYEEFRELPTVTARADEVPVGCETKNRYANVVPLPETRVYLKRLNDEEQTEYINANYIRLPKDPSNYYIACQAPMDQTVVDFWRMIWEQSSRVIIMATDLIENGIEKCAEYMPSSIVLDNHLTFGDFTVTLRSREVKDKYAISMIHLKNNATNTWREITHLWYQWPETGVPADEASVVAMLLEARSYLKMATPEQIDTTDCINEKMKKQLENGDAIDKTKSLQRVQGPLTVHCSPGTGRTGTIIACDIAIRALEKPIRSVDIPQIVYYIRRGRGSAVLTREQYEFIYKVAHMYATKLTGPIPEN